MPIGQLMWQASAYSTALTPVHPCLALPCLQLVQQLMDGAVLATRPDARLVHLGACMAAGFFCFGFK